MGTVRTAVRVEGVVQGVGFRPFVHALATGLGLTGLVGNDVDGVFAEVEGPDAAVREFLDRLERDAPPLARIERISTAAIAPRREAEFVIAPSQAAGPRRTLISADTATCADCLRELADPADRRFGYLEDQLETDWLAWRTVSDNRQAKSVSAQISRKPDQRTGSLWRCSSRNRFLRRLAPLFWCQGNMRTQDAERGCSCPLECCDDCRPRRSLCRVTARVH